MTPGPSGPTEGAEGRAAGGRPSSRPDADHLSELLEKVATAQDRKAFAELFLALGPSVKGMALRQGADAVAAEELAQDTFLMVWRKAASYSRQRGAASAWIYAIARNLRIDRLRAQIPWQELTDDMQEEQAPDPSPEQSLYTRQIQTRMRVVVERLPPEQSEVIRLAYYDGLSHSEIAEKLKVPLGTVKTRLNLAYRKIRGGAQEFK